MKIFLEFKMLTITVLTILYYIYGGIENHGLRWIDKKYHHRNFGRSVLLENLYRYINIDFQNESV